VSVDFETLDQTLKAARERLLGWRVSDGHWEGELSASALSTATSICALSLLRRARTGSGCHDDYELRSLVRRGFTWLVQCQNEDGGWGDTVGSPSNISTTVLCWAVLRLADETGVDVSVSDRAAESWIRARAGGTSAHQIGVAIDKVYGQDKTFSVPILTMCALCGRLGGGRDGWKQVKTLPFELAACPHQLFKWLGLPVVSYALPALIAIGQVRHFHRPTHNPIARLLRALTRARTLRVLRRIQPASGGFLEAAPLTGFVLMSLASMGRADSESALAAERFLVETVRRDGSWPIDTNLASWLTTLSIGAIDVGGGLVRSLSQCDRDVLLEYILGQQYSREHPYTRAAPGGWAWTHLTGGVPDADDTSGALLALRALFQSGTFDPSTRKRIERAVENGARWLVDLQNRDGGIPTFCRGWGKLPFDQSSPDLTAHALRAWGCWTDVHPQRMRKSISSAARRAVAFLLRVQRTDGSWIPLWFGNQHTPDQTNPLYGTSRVVCAFPLDFTSFFDTDTHRRWRESCLRGVRWILQVQNDDGGWGGGVGAASSIEETALAVEALVCSLRERSRGGSLVGDDHSQGNPTLNGDSIQTAIESGVQYLIARTQVGTEFDPSPIGLYFAKLWYSERLYPVIFTVSALGTYLKDRCGTGLRSLGCVR